MAQVRKTLTMILALALLAPTGLVVEAQTDATDGSTSAVTSTSTGQATSHRSLRHATRVRRAQEGEPPARRHHHRISKAQVAMMAGVAGTSMAIGALAGGGEGLAIGAIVGGWSAYAVHRLWKYIH